MDTKAKERIKSLLEGIESVKIKALLAKEQGNHKSAKFCEIIIKRFEIEIERLKQKS